MVETLMNRSRLLPIGAFLLVASGSASSQETRDAAVTLPNPLRMLDGTPANETSWPTRRDEIRELFAGHMYGRMPPVPADIRFETLSTEPRAMDGGATRREVRVAWKGGTLDLLLVVPNEPKRRPGVLLGLNFYGNHSVLDDPGIRLSKSWMPARAKGVTKNRATDASRGTSAGRWPIGLAIKRGWSVATFYHGDVQPDDAKQAPDSDKGDATGAIARWAFGLHRAMDYLAKDATIDAKRVVVFGHSRNGKAALLAGATDDRFAITISNQSGCGGAAMSRRRSGETVRVINERFPHWFCNNFRRYNDKEDDLPLDQHMLVSLLAPRPVLICSATRDLWADPEGELQSLQLAAPVYRLLGVADAPPKQMPNENVPPTSRLGYHIRPGRHGIGARDWRVFLDFAERHLGN